MVKIKLGLGFSTIKKGINVLLNEKDAEKRIVPYIVGEAGIGKSKLVKEIAKERNAFYKEINCALMQEGDLVMPVPDREATIDKDDNDKLASIKFALNTIITEFFVNEKVNPQQEGILLLDEYNRASSAVQAEMMNLVLQRELVGVKIPNNLRIIMTANPSSDMEGFEESEYHVNSVDGAINDRTMRIRMNANLTDWLSGFAKTVVNEDGKTQVHPVVIDFLENGNDMFFLEEDNSRDKKATPRAWERVSNLLYTYEQEGITYGANEFTSFINEGIRGSIGDKVGTQFITYLTNAAYFIKPQEILDADANKHEELMKKFLDMQSVRQSRVVETFVDYLALAKNKELIGNEKNVKRLITWVISLNHDSMHVMMLKIANEKLNNDFVNYTALYDAITKFDSDLEYGQKEYEITLRASRLKA